VDLAILKMESNIASHGNFSPQENIRLSRDQQFVSKVRSIQCLSMRQDVKQELPYSINKHNDHHLCSVMQRPDNFTYVPRWAAQIVK
jgi:hypothetical protein